MARRIDLRRWCVWAALLLGGCGRGGGEKPNLFLIVVDALRADHVAGEALSADLTPTLAELAKRSTVFRRARAQSSWTLPSIASLFVSRFPSQHGVISFKARLADGETTLAEELHLAGYRTAAFSGNVLLTPASGFAQGFDDFHSLGKPHGAGGAAPKPRAADIDRDLVAWLDALPSPRPPLFVYLHYMETHTPYLPDAESLERVLSARGRSAEQRARLGQLFFHPDQFKEDREMASLLEDLYAAELVSLDRQLGSLFADLAARHLLEDSIVVLTADHGEEFFEHEALGHGRTLFEEVLRVPLVVARSGGAAAEVEAPVSLIDVAPTLLAAAAGAPPPPAFEGRSLAPLLGGFTWRERIAAKLCGFLGLACVPPAPSFAELPLVPVKAGAPAVFHRRSLVDGEAKAFELSDGSRRDYDLSRSPFENDAETPPAARAQSLDASLAAFAARLAGKQNAEERPAIDEETRERMRRLGYATDD